MDLFKTAMDPREINRISCLGLAHLGDAVYELMVRTYLCAQGVQAANKLHRQTVLRVSAPAQSEASKNIIDILSGEEKSIFLRGRNTKVNSVPQGASRSEYQNATALETLFGYIYLTGNLKRLNELFIKAMETAPGNN